ncbi:MAG: polyphosphate kinase 2 [Ilumatobacter sp.]|jgi:polyphosphate kinase|uniref:polyphosphate kinase 2 n=1 Tax=Ilumatobacter sp. TaxID=1967498 RepID=UPI00391981E3
MSEQPPHAQEVQYGTVDAPELIRWLRELSPEEFVERGFSVHGTFDEVDDPVLIGPNGLPIESWREGYPFDERLSRAEYDRTKRLLQIELLKAQAWISETGQRLVVVFEGRDAAGKGGTIKRFTEHLNPRGTTVVALGVPSERERGQWYFQRYVSLMPTAGEITLFDRSWYNRAVVERVMGFCTPDQHEQFMLQVPEVERLLVESGTKLVKLWFSVSRREQLNRFTIRHIDPVRQWKLSPVDLASLDKWDSYTAAKNEMFARTHTGAAPWTVVRSNDKKRGRVEAMRFVLDQLDYPEKDESVVGSPNSAIVGPPDVTGMDEGEQRQPASNEWASWSNG